MAADRISALNKTCLRYGCVLFVTANNELYVWNSTALDKVPTLKAAVIAEERRMKAWLKIIAQKPHET